MHRESSDVTDEMIEAARRVFERRHWSVPKRDESVIRAIRRALEAAMEARRGTE